MAQLEIEFHCLCLFVRDEANNIVHVLMPTTHHDPHVVMLYHASFPDGKRIHGLELVLAGTGSAVLSTLAPNERGEIVDLTKVTDRGTGGRKTPADRVSTKHPKVLTRVRLKSGKVIDRDHQAEWLFRDTPRRMAYKVVWEISGVADKLEWNDLNNPDAIPFQSLSELEPDGTIDGELFYRFRIFHTTPDRLPPNDTGPGMDPVLVRRHFTHLYDVLDHHPLDDELPAPPFVGKFNCGAGQALLE